MGLSITALAAKIAAVGDAGDHEGGDMDALIGQSRSEASRPFLPPERAEKEDGQGWIPEAEMQSVPKETADCGVE